MATVERLMPVSPAAVWTTLADASAYAHWVVGSKEIRAADSAWPAPGSRFHHTVGVGPLALRDHTEALEAREGRLLRLRAKARPLGTATVTLELVPGDGGTLVRMTETPEGIGRALELNPFYRLLVNARNARSLERLQTLSAGTGS